jgi:hypothetical protein
MPWGMKDDDRVGELPSGWTLERFAQTAQLRGESPQLLPLSTEVLEEDKGGHDQVSADLIIKLGDLYLVRDEGTGEFLMGALQEDVIVCWASYGDDIAEALRSL